MKPRIPASRKNIKSLQNARLQSAASGMDGESSLQGGNAGVSGHNVGSCPENYQKPIPLIVHDGPLFFEGFMFFYCILSLLLQHLHLYKSVWWLPHSYNNYAMNFYLIDVQLIAFCVVVLARRLVWTIIKKLISAVMPAGWSKSIIIVARSLNTFAILIGLLYLSSHIYPKYQGLNMLYLTYPVTVYFLLFGFSGEPFLELIPSTSTGKIRIVSDKSGLYHTTGPSSAPFLQINSSPGSPTTAAGNGQTTATNQPEQVRQEVAILKSDFNSRLKQVIFNTIVSAYYGAIIPCMFAPSQLYFDMAWVFRHSLLVAVGSLVLYVVYMFPGSYILMMNRTAALLGSWTKIENRPAVANLTSMWNASVMCSINTTVKHQNGLYKSEGNNNCAEPGNVSHSRFYWFFKDMSSLQGCLLVLQSGLIMAQHISLNWSTHWYQLLSGGLMLFSNYYALFKVSRDYIVFWKYIDIETGSTYS